MQTVETSRVFTHIARLIHFWLQVLRVFQRSDCQHRVVVCGRGYASRKISRCHVRMLAWVTKHLSLPYALLELCRVRVLICLGKFETTLRAALRRGKSGDSPLQDLKRCSPPPICRAPCCSCWPLIHLLSRGLATDVGALGVVLGASALGELDYGNESSVYGRFWTCG